MRLGYQATTQGDGQPGQNVDALHDGGPLPDGAPPPFDLTFDGGTPDGAPPDLPDPDLPHPDPDLPHPDPDLPQPDPDLPQPDPDLPPPDPDLPQPDPDLPQPDPDLAQPDLPQPDLPQPDLPQPDAGCVPPTGWWDSSYLYRRGLTVSESVSGTLAAGYTVVVVLDTQAAVSAGKLRSDGADLRVVRQGSELHRRVVGIGTTQTEIWFKTPAAVDGADSGYALYYGNPAAVAPPSHWADSMGTDATPSQVYLAADDFEDDAVGSQPDGWEGSAKYTVQQASGNQVLRVLGSSPNADYLFAGDYGWTDVVVQARLRVVLTGGEHYGLFARAGSATNFDTLWFGLETNSKAALYTCKVASASATGLTGSIKGTWPVVPPAGTSWHTVELRLAGQQAAVLFDGVQKTVYTFLPNQMKQGRIGLCAGYPASEAHWDDVVVRRYVAPEPTVAPSPEESACP